MKHILLLTFLAVAPLSATVIDFEAEATNIGGSLTGIPDSPLTIGLATFTGGELRSDEIGLPADRTGLYATQGVFGSGETNPPTISFAAPIGGFSVFIANGDNTATYTISDDLGDSVSASLASAGAAGTRVFSLPAVDIRSIEITSSNADGWNFAIDNVVFTAIPEPNPIWLVPVALSLLGCFRANRSIG